MFGVVVVILILGVGIVGVGYEIYFYFRVLGKISFGCLCSISSLGLFNSLGLSQCLILLFDRYIVVLSNCLLILISFSSSGLYAIEFI